MKLIAFCLNTCKCFKPQALRFTLKKKEMVYTLIIKKKYVSSLNKSDVNLTFKYFDEPLYQLKENNYSLYEILRSQHYANILKKVYTHASNTSDPLQHIDPTNFNETMIKSHNRVSELESQKLNNDNTSSSSSLPPIKIRKDTASRPVYSLRVPRGLPTPTKFQKTRVIPTRKQQSTGLQPLTINSNNQVLNFSPSSSLRLQSFIRSRQKKSLSYETTETKSYSQGTTYTSSAGTNEKNDMLQTYNYHYMNEPTASVSKSLFESIKLGALPTQRIGIHYSPLTQHLTTYLLEYNDRHGRHPLSQLKKSDLSSSELEAVKNYHNNAFTLLAPDKDAKNNRQTVPLKEPLLQPYDPLTDTYKMAPFSDEQAEIMESLKKYPLEYFDVDEDEPVKQLKMGPFRPVYGYAKYYDGEHFIWEKCKVLKYDEKQKKFFVEFTVIKHSIKPLTTEEEIARENANLPKSGHEHKEIKVISKWLTRLKIRFDEEDSKGFFERVQHCERRKKAVLLTHQYWNFASFQRENGPTVSHEQLEKILNLLDGMADFIVDHPSSVTNLLVQVRAQYELAMKAALLEYVRKNNFEKKRLKKLNLPHLSTSKVPERGTIDIAKRSFEWKAIVKGLEEWMIIKYPKLYQTWLEIIKDFEAISSKHCLVKISNRGKPITLHRFKERQDEHLMAVQDFVSSFFVVCVCVYTYLIVNWRDKTINLVRDLDLGPAFDFYVKSKEAYEKMPLSRYLKRLDVLMREQLTTYVMNSLQHWVTFLKRCTFKQPITQKDDLWIVNLTTESFFYMI
ncbi:dynein heavy chain protein [Reticulomyxa filosa]|uniref:Dynein heavy chain protein n=1 Tax=Reticulomyxa filosa TaxID=46433 RepID=X6P0T4_RETFI|nr:dynein heavy chain protein [Reticulomyxa filosa]|eukprot:ETO31147.1 dynein heavy chain protein [Reticulomyxa filosa]